MYGTSRPVLHALVEMCVSVPLHKLADASDVLCCVSLRSYISRSETNKEGKTMRRFVPCALCITAALFVGPMHVLLVFSLRQLVLEREKWPYMVGPWTILHHVKKDNGRYHAVLAVLLRLLICVC